MAIRNCSQILGLPNKKPEKQALKICYVPNWPIPKVPLRPIPIYVLNFRLNFKVVLVVLGEILPQWEVALVSGHQKLQSDMEVTY